MQRGTLLRAAGMIALIGLYLVVLAKIDREGLPPQPNGQIEDPSPADGLAVELRHCNALGTQDAENPYCRAAWAENRRRFFGLPSKTPLRAPTAQPATSPANPQSSNAEGARP
jgi:conjugative transfer region protein TrbK